MGLVHYWTFFTADKNRVIVALRPVMIFAEYSHLSHSLQNKLTLDQLLLFFRI